MKRLRCETPYCENEAVILVSRVDAIRDWKYLCETDGSYYETTTTVWEPSRFRESKVLSVAQTIGFFPPKHRAVTKKDALAILEAWEVSDERAEEIARWNPRHAIEGWAGGHRANGDDREAAVFERALEIQDSWKEAPGL